MEKILKRILIPFLFILLTIKSAYAETIDLYCTGIGPRCDFVDTYVSNPYSMFNVDLYNQNFNFSISGTKYYINSATFYLSESNQYLILFFYNTSNDISSINFDIDIYQNNNDYCYSYYNSSDIKVNKCDKFGFGFITNSYYKQWYVDNLSWPIYNVNEVNSNNYSYITNYSSTYSNNIKYVIDNLSSLQLLSVNKGNFYVNGNLIGSASGEIPEEPEPEEPEIPIFNENLNKFYVPNYQEGQCVEVLDKDTIRVFNDNTTSFYTDYFINSNYISRTGQVDIDYEKNCSTLEFTSDYKYRNDLSKICFIALCIIGFAILPCYVLWKVFYKRG